jgi:putative ABC transport system permease protein
MGIRMALGAGPAAVLRRLLVEGMRPVVLGAALGVGLGYALLRGLAASFYGVEPWNPGMYMALASLLLLTALVAVWLPSRSALKMDPARVLAEE